MQPRWLITGLVFILCGALELGFFALTVLGVLSGAVLSVGGFVGGEFEAAFMGVALFFIYGAWFFCTIIPAALHLVVGTMLLMGKRPIKLLWAATIASILPLFTVYCAPTALIGGVLGLLALVIPETESEAHARSRQEDLSS